MRSRDDLVADAEQGRAVEHAVAQSHGRGECDGVAREQRQLHAALTLGDPVAHRRHAARDLRGGADLTGEQLHLLRVAAVG